MVSIVCPVWEIVAPACVPLGYATLGARLGTFYTFHLRKTGISLKLAQTDVPDYGSGVMLLGARGFLLDFMCTFADCRALLG